LSWPRTESNTRSQAQVVIVGTAVGKRCSYLRLFALPPRRFWLPHYVWQESAFSRSGIASNSTLQSGMPSRCLKANHFGRAIRELHSGAIPPTPTNPLLSSLRSKQTMPSPSSTPNSPYELDLPSDILSLSPPTLLIILPITVTPRPAAPCPHIPMQPSSARLRTNFVPCSRELEPLCQFIEPPMSERPAPHAVVCVVPSSPLLASFPQLQRTSRFPKADDLDSLPSLAYGLVSPSSWSVCMVSLYLPEKLNACTLGLCDDLHLW